MAEFMLDTVEIASPYIIGGIIGVFIAGGLFFYLTRDYKQRIQCATCRKKMFSTSQDVPLSDVTVQRRLEKFRYLVQTGQVSEDIH